MKSLFAVLFTVAVAAPAFADGGHDDVWVYSDGSQVQIGAAEGLDTLDPEFEPGVNVFEAFFKNPADGDRTPNLPIGPYEFEAAEPGFRGQVVPGFQSLPTNAAMTLNESSFTLGSGFDTTHYWDGSGGAVNFQPLSVVQPNVDFTYNPVQFATTDGSSFVDDHPLFGLSTSSAALPADGVYLARLTVDVAGLATSDPFYMVWLASSDVVGEDEEEELLELLEMFEEGDIMAPVFENVDYTFFEEAVEFAQAIPEPTTAVLASLMALAAVARRR